MSYPAPSTPTFSTERLVFRAVDSKKDGDIFKELNQDPYTILRANNAACLPYTSRDSERMLQFSDNALVSVLICLPASPETPTLAGKEIGWICLSGIPPSQIHHRKTTFGVGLLPEYQRQGYGREALEWLLRIAFCTLGLNKVEGEAFSWNTRALKLYAALGFKMEGRKRKSLWQEGGFRDEVVLGLLAEEWHESKKT